MRPRNLIKGQISASEIEVAYRKAFNVPKESWFRKFIRWLFGFGSIFQFADSYYREVDEELIRMILDADVGDKEEYETEWYDCDDFAFALMGVFHQSWEAAAMSIFIAWVSTPEGGHAVLSYCSSKGSIRIIEPQNDQIFSVPGDWGLMLLCG